MRAAVVWKMYELRFGERLPAGLTIQQVRGKEGVRVREAYAKASRETNVSWNGRQYDRSEWNASDAINRALSTAAACLNGLAHAAIISTGYSPALGFVHTGKLLSFVYDIVDLYRLEVAVPVAFECTAAQLKEIKVGALESAVRRAMRTRIREAKLLDRIVRDLDTLFSLDQAAVAAAASWFDTERQDPSLLWNPDGLKVDGGVNYASRSSDEHSS